MHYKHKQISPKILTLLDLHIYTFSVKITRLYLFQISSIYYLLVFIRFIWSHVFSILFLYSHMLIFFLIISFCLAQKIVLCAKFHVILIVSFANLAKSGRKILQDNISSCKILQEICMVLQGNRSKLSLVRAEILQTVAATGGLIFLWI